MQKTMRTFIVLAFFAASAKICFAQNALDCSKAIQLTCGQTISDNTQGSPSNVKTYTGVTWNESGPEDVFTIQVQETSRLIVTLSKLTVNLDVFILESCDASKVLASGDRKAIYANAKPGKYYIVVDGRDNAVGAYNLTVQCENGNSPTGNIIWSDSFENNPDKDWNSDYGVWEMGVPTSGPNSAFVGGQCAATKLAGDYPDNVNTRLIRFTSFVVPNASLKPRLRFWHWYNFNCGDYGKVQVKVQGTNIWEDLPDAIFSGHSSGIWSYRTDSLSKYAGKTIQIAFFFHSEDCWPPGWDTSSGWYIDNVALVTGSETMNFPEKWEPMGIKDWQGGYGTCEVGVPTSGPDSAYSPPYCLATVLDGVYGDNANSWFTSPPFKVPSASKQPSLRYRHWYSFNCGDWGQIRIYSNKTWTTLDTYSGSSSGWTYPRLDLSAYADSTVSLRFVFHSEDCWPPGWETDNGWYIDDIEINGFETCLYSISPTTSPNFPASGGSGNVNVTAIGTNCNWTAASKSNWIKISSGNSGAGNGTVAYTVDPNSSPNARTDTLLIAEKKFIVKQEGTPTNPPIVPIVTNSTQFANQEFWVDVKVGETASPVTNLFGVSLCLTFTNTNFIDVVTPYASTVISGDFLGNDVVFQSNVDEAAGKVCIGISRKAGQSGVNGSGTLMRIKLIARSNIPDKTPGQFCVTDVIANDPNGNSISLTPSCANVTINQCVTVWPGDTNNDGKVDQVDVLPLGLYWGRTGSACASSQSCAWNARCCTPWTTLATTYADANGDGVVNQVDVLCLGLNWNKTHTTNFSLDSSAPLDKTGSVASASLAPDVKPVQAPNQEFFVRIKASEVNNLFGLSFELLYDQSNFVQILAVEPDSLLGSDVVFYSNVEASAGKIAVGISRKAGQTGITGTGSTVRVKAIISSNIPDKTIIRFSLQNAVANDANSAPIQLALQSASTTVMTTSIVFHEALFIPTEYRLEQNHPNPFNPATTIKFALPHSAHVTLRIFDLVGRQIATLIDEELAAGGHETRWEANGVESGVYLYQLRAGEFVETKRLLLVK